MCFRVGFNLRVGVVLGVGGNIYRYPGKWNGYPGKYDGYPGGRIGYPRAGKDIQVVLVDIQG